MEFSVILSTAIGVSVIITNIGLITLYKLFRGEICFLKKEIHRLEKRIKRDEEYEYL